jgi:nascent polypeptide-associated complex subunit alpha
MPSVSDELEALRNRNLTKNLAGKLKNAATLSTPEKEHASLQQTNQTRRTSAYQKEAADNLKAGTKAIDQDLEFKRKQTALKKEDKQKQKEASNHRQSFNQAKVATSALTGNKKKENKIEQDDEAAQKSTKQETTASVSTPAAAPPAAASVSTPDVAAVAAAVPVPAAPAPAPATKTAPKPIPAAAAVAPATKAAPTPSMENTDDTIPVLVEQDDVPELEDQVPVAPSPSQQTQSYIPAPPAKRVPNRAEKKSKKAMEKLGMKGVLGISRVTLKMGGNQGFYTIHQPDVYEKNGTYIVFGEAQQGAGGMEQRKQAERAAKMLETPVPALEKVPTTGAATAPPAAAAEMEADEVVDESGLEAKDIDLVVGQSGCSRSKAVVALRENNGDLVNAIMSLTL